MIMYEYNDTDDRVSVVAEINKLGKESVELPERKCFYVLEPYEYWDGTKVIADIASYTDKCKVSKLAELRVFILDKVRECIADMYKVDIDFNSPITLSRVFELLVQSQMTIEEIFGKTEEVYQYFVPKAQTLAAQIQALDTVDDINAYNIEEHYNELN